MSASTTSAVVTDELRKLPLDTPDLIHAAALRVIEQVPKLPLPGSGSTWERWTFFAQAGAWDLCLFKVLEAHYDACAILSELCQPPPRSGELWGVWAAEPPDAVLEYSGEEQGHVDGIKRWCSGATIVTHALVTAHRGEDRCLVALAMQQPAIKMDETTWQAVGMQRVHTLEIAFAGVPARLVGQNYAYLNRPGFWHGGGGIAAGWLGAARAVVGPLLKAKGLIASPHQLVHLGAVDTALRVNEVMLREIARLIDAQPELPHDRAVLQLRTSVDGCCAEVLARVGRALGAVPLCQNGAHAWRVADLGVFTRQAHAERDLQALGEAAVEADASWPV